MLITNTVGPRPSRRLHFERRGAGSLSVEILLVTHDPNLSSYRNRELVLRLKRRNANPIVVAPEQLVFIGGKPGPAVWHIDGYRLNPDLVVNALYRNSGTGLDAIRFLEEAGLPVINSSSAWYAAKVKPLASIRLAAKGLPHPPSLFSYQAPVKIARHLFNRKRQKHVVLKPKSGSLGRGLVRYKNGSSLPTKIRLWQKKRQYVYAQSFVRNPGRDIRAVVIGDQVVGATYRLAPKGNWRTNVALGGKPKNCPVTPALRELAIKATRAIGLDVAGVDLIESPSGLQILEVNAWPNYEQYDRIVGIDVADELAQFIINCARTAALLA